MTESELVKKALAGDEACKERLVKEYGGLVKRLSDIGWATFREDAFPMGWLAVWEALPRFDSTKGRLSTFVGSVVKSKILDARRDASPVTRAGKPRITTVQLNELNETYDCGYLQDIEGPLLAESIHGALVAKLDDKRKSLLSAVLDEMPVDHWAVSYGLSKGRGQQLIQDIRAKTRELLAA